MARTAGTASGAGVAGAASGAGVAGGDVLALEATGLVKRFGSVAAVRGVDLRVAPGETLGLLGPNGAGKTTCISLVAGLLRPDDGEVRISGEPMGARPLRAKRHVGLVPQDLAIYPELTARENLKLFGRLYGLGGAALTARVGEMLELVGLTAHARAASRTFSGGMKRRLNIAAALLHEPDLLILDEPTVGVDPQSRNAILEAVSEWAGRGLAVLYTTHYMEEAERLCDRIAIMDSGRILVEGPRNQLLKLAGGLDTVVLRGRGDVARLAGDVALLPGVGEVVPEEGAVRLRVPDAHRRIGDLVAAAGRAGLEVHDFEIHRPSLESVFLMLTGKALRD